MSVVPEQSYDWLNASEAILKNKMKKQRAVINYKSTTVFQLSALLIVHVASKQINFAYTLTDTKHLYRNTSEHLPRL